MKTLLLNQSYEVLSFIPFKKVIKLIVKSKVEIISEWNAEYRWIEGSIKHPSIVRMKYYIKRPPLKPKFNRHGIFKRDQYLCGYCGVAVTPSTATLDHVIPQSQGGKNTWENMLTSCLPCNSKKANRTPDQAGMKPLFHPSSPRDPLGSEFLLLNPRHPDWDMYFKKY